MPKQDFTLLDYSGPLVVGALFTICLALISFFVLNFYCVKSHDDFTVFEKWGARRGFRLGPHDYDLTRAVVEAEDSGMNVEYEA